MGAGRGERHRQWSLSSRIAEALSSSRPQCSRAQPSPPHTRLVLLFLCPRGGWKSPACPSGLLCRWGHSLPLSPVSQPVLANPIQILERRGALRGVQSEWRPCAAFPGEAPRFCCLTAPGRGVSYSDGPRLCRAACTSSCRGAARLWLITVKNGALTRALNQAAARARSHRGCQARCEAGHYQQCGRWRNARKPVQDKTRPN